MGVDILKFEKLLIKCDLQEAEDHTIIGT